MQEQEKRGPGRPRQSSEKRERMYFTLSHEVVEFLNRLPAGDRSAFVEQAIHEKRYSEKKQEGYR